MSFSTNKACVRKIVWWQLVFAVVVPIGLMLLRGPQAFLPGLAGLLACWLPSFLFMQILFARVRRPSEFVMMFAFGEMLRLAVSGVLFVLVMKIFSQGIFAALLGFVAAIPAFWVAALTFFLRQKQQACVVTA